MVQVRPFEFRLVLLIVCLALSAGNGGVAWGSTAPTSPPSSAPLTDASGNVSHDGGKTWVDKHGNTSTDGGKTWHDGKGHYTDDGGITWKDAQGNTSTDGGKTWHDGKGHYTDDGGITWKDGQGNVSTDGGQTWDDGKGHYTDDGGVTWKDAQGNISYDGGRTWSGPSQGDLSATGDEPSTVPGEPSSGSSSAADVHVPSTLFGIPKAVMALAKILNPMTSPADRVRIAAEFGIDLAKYGFDKSGNLIKAGKQIGDKIGSAISNAGSKAKDAIETVGGKIVKPLGRSIEKADDAPSPGKAVIRGAKTTIKKIFGKDGPKPQEPVTSETTAGSAMNE